MVVVGAIPAMVVPVRHKMFAKSKGKREPGVLKRTLKALAWRKEKKEKINLATSGEVKLASLNNIMEDGVKKITMKGKKANLLAILHQEDVWICDIRASNHAIWCYKRAVNLCDMQLLCLNHTGEAIEITDMIDVRE